jgi:hypothetical protein
VHRADLVGGQAHGEPEADMTALKVGADLLDELIGIRSIQRRRRTELKYDRLWCQVMRNEPVPVSLPVVTIKLMEEDCIRHHHLINHISTYCLLFPFVDFFFVLLRTSSSLKEHFITERQDELLNECESCMILWFCVL